VTTELYLSGEMVEVARAMIREGFFNQLRLHSHTSQYGQLSRAERMAPKALLEVVDAVMAEIRSGDFAKEWAAEQEKGLPTLERLRQRAFAHPLSRSEKTLEELRKKMASWMSA
jgi:ketol-acid reductoisomerase